MNVINSIKAIIILNNYDGRRILSKYYDDSLQSVSTQFEKDLFLKTKTKKIRGEVIVLNGMLIVHKCPSEAPNSHVYIVGGKNENPLVLDGLLNCMIDIIESFPRESSEGNVILENKSGIIMALDEICDSGLILEMDPNLVNQRISSAENDDFESLKNKVGRIFGL